MLGLNLQWGPDCRDPIQVDREGRGTHEMNWKTGGVPSLSDASQPRRKDFTTTLGTHRRSSTFAASPFRYEACHLSLTATFRTWGHVLERRLKAKASSHVGVTHTTKHDTQKIWKSS